MQIGYARVATSGQPFAAQLDALKHAGCRKIFRDVASGAKAPRPGLDGALKALRTGDTLVVSRLDRLGRSLTQLISMITTLSERDIGFRSLEDALDTTADTGIRRTIAALFAFERELLRERTKVGLDAARAHGKKGGRRPKLDTPEKIQLARQLYEDEANSIASICERLNISRATLYRYVRPRPSPALASSPAMAFTAPESYSSAMPGSVTIPPKD